MYKDKILKHKGYIFYTFFKYMEYGILAFIFMSFANMVSPEEYGQASAGFQIITYSAFLVLGVNQVLLKRYSLEENEAKKGFYLQYNILYNLIVCLIAIVLISILFINKDYVFYLAIICGFKLILESSIAVNRVKGNMTKINIIYLSYALLFLVLYLTLVSNVLNFFKYWSYAIILGAFTGAILSLFAVVKDFKLTVFKVYLKEYSTVLFNDGIKLALIALISPLFSTLSIICLNFFKVEDTIIGNFQLADNIANLVSLGGASILFIVFPDVIKKMKKNPAFGKKIYDIGIKAFFISVVLLFAAYYPLKELLLYFFPEYEKLPYLILFTLISRLLVLLLFVPNSFWITFSKEKFYIAKSIVGVLIMGLVFTTFLSLATTEQIYDYFLIFQILILAVLHIFFRRKIIREVR